MTRDLSGLLGDLIAVAEKAGAEIMRQYGNAEIRAKADASPVTDADEAAEAIILERLAALAPEIPVVAEESVAREALRTQRDVPAQSEARSRGRAAGRGAWPAR